MENRIRRLFLDASGILLLLSQPSAFAVELIDEKSISPVIRPEIARMEFNEAKIESDNFEIIASLGLLSIEDFETNALVGFKLSYHLSESFFVNTEVGLSTAGTSSAEVLLPGTTILSDDEKEYTYYIIGLGYDLFPGEVFMTENTTYNTAFYLYAGAGNTEFAGSDHFTLSFGAGFRVVPSNNFSFSLDIRDHTFNIDALGADKLSNNIEISFGMGMYF